MGRTGHCLCNAVSYSIDGDPIATVVCHCHKCQRQGGLPFSLNLMVHESQLSIDGALSTFEDRGELGDAVYVRRRFCGSCGSPIVSELVQTEGLVAVKAGTLDDTSGLEPVAEVWCVDRQPWIELPAMAVSLERES